PLFQAPVGDLNDKHVLLMPGFLNLTKILLLLPAYFCDRTPNISPLLGFHPVIHINHKRLK
ncbi:hypothetical protein, partial [Enterobacter hormaechei]|uniref:hypothetical protein n=1 Tax=Enterobacter hormaechei TaxID=158836 RepID=UPI001C535422